MTENKPSWKPTNTPLDDPARYVPHTTVNEEEWDETYVIRDGDTYNE